MHYRREVDGLRALAIVPVILFHANVVGFTGGFLGVDIFFVISGYLITSLIERDLDKNRFSIVNFYLRRFRRILPALLVMVSLTIIPAYFLMIPDDLENYGESLVATSLSANNILLYLTQDYFAMGAEFKPLIHTWSLGVEEQYYFAIPLLMSLAYSIGRKRSVTILIAAVSIVSLGVCVWASHANPNANFYLIFSRAWELGAGALAALGEPRLRAYVGKAGSAFASVGVALIVVPLFTFGGDTSLPGIPTLVPVLGTVLVLLYASPTNAAGKVLGSRLLVGIGLLSYSAYLYHQPIFVFARVARLDPPSTWLLLALVPVVFLLSYLSWRFVERPFRDPGRISTPVMLAAVSFGSMAVGAVGLIFYVTSGFYAHWPELANNDPNFGAQQNSSYNMRPFTYANRSFDRSGTKVLVLGNSFARDFINMGLETGALSGAQISYGAIDECQPLPATQVTVARSADFIILGSGVGKVYLPCVRRLIKLLHSISHASVIVMGTKGFGYNNNAVMLLPASIRYSYRAMPAQNVIDDDNISAAALSPDMYVSILGMISDKKGRVPIFTPDHKFISQDKKHLTKAGAAYIGAIVFRARAFSPLLLATEAKRHLAQDGATQPVSSVVK